MALEMNYWLVKSEPETFSWDDLVRDGHTNWDGVRNYQARNNLKAMQRGDRVLFYHSITDKAVVGIAEIQQEAFVDLSGGNDLRWVAVELIPLKPLKKPIPLDYIKTDPHLTEMPLVKHSRLSVMPVSPEQFRRIVNLSEEE